MTGPTCGDCGNNVTRFGHKPKCRRLRVYRLVDSDGRIEFALKQENGQSPKGREQYVRFMARMAHSLTGVNDERS